MSHITGGGLTENIPRVLPKGTGCFVDVTTWKRPEVFAWLQKNGNVASKEMARTFNNGIGMVLVVTPEKVDEVQASILATGEETVHIIGQVTSTSGVELRGLHAWA
jgi:phosphoribosylamine--glycine ligase/phosphoribosylformylglycinamidine cyclo-ligase